MFKKIALSLSTVLISMSFYLNASSQPALSPWPMFRQNQLHTGRSGYTGPRTPVILWSFVTGGDIDSSPAVGTGGMIYFGSADNNFYALNSDGTLAWTYLAWNDLFASPALASDGTVYIPASDAADFPLLALNNAGSLGWSYGLGGRGWHPTIASDGRIYLGSSDNNTYVFNPNGTLVWSYETADNLEASPLVGSAGGAYTGSYDNNFYAMDSAGALIWSYDTNSVITSSAAMGTDGRIFFGNWAGLVVALNSDGTLAWSYGTAGGIDSSPGIMEDGTVLIGSADFKFYAINSDGTLKWFTGTLDQVNTSAAIGSDGLIYGGADDNRIYVLDSDGSRLWSYVTEDDITSSAAIGSDGKVFIGGDDNIMYCITDPTPTPTPVLEVSPGEMRAGSSFYFTVTLREDINELFDYYLVASTQFGPYTLYFNGHYEEGVKTLYRSVPGYPAPFQITVIPNVILPLNMAGNDVSFITGVVEAGKVPPVPNVDAVDENSPYIILFNKKTVGVNPHL